ncbi:MAG: DUF3108 domain-containing protein [Caldimonas sp.]
MARRLTGFVAPPWRGARRAAFVAVVVAVVWGHLTVTHEVATELAAIQAANAMPARIQVAYVRTLEPETPKTAAPDAPRRAAARRALHVARAAAEAASAAVAEPPVAEAPVTDAIDAAASAPEAAIAAADVASAPEVSVAAASSPSDAAPRVAAADPASAPATDTFVWPSATKVSYVLNGNYRGPINGRAEVEWIRVDDRYQVNVDLFAGPEFAPIFSRRMTSEGRVAASGLVPDRYDEETQFLMRDRRRVSVVFAPDSVELADGQKRERLAGVQDTASQFIQFTWLFGSKPDLLRVGASFEFPLALPRSMKRWTYDVVDAETLYTPFGELPVFHLKPRIVERKPGELTVEMWFSPELRYLPVRIRIDQDAGTYIDLVIAKKPEIAAS